MSRSPRKYQRSTRCNMSPQVASCRSRRHMACTLAGPGPMCTCQGGNIRTRRCRTHCTFLRDRPICTIKIRVWRSIDNCYHMHYTLGFRLKRNTGRHRRAYKRYTRICQHSNQEGKEHKRSIQVVSICRQGTDRTRTMLSPPQWLRKYHQDTSDSFRSKRRPRMDCTSLPGTKST
jgi:hypothetical protein